MTEVTIRMMEEQPTLVMWGKVAAKDLPLFLERAFEAAAAQAEAIGAEICGPPFARYRPLDSGFTEFEVEAGLPVSGDHVTGSEEVDVSALPAGPAAVTLHVGPYDTMVAAYDRVRRFLEEQHAEPLGPPWEVYLTGPDEEPDPARWRTEIVQPFTA